MPDNKPTTQVLYETCDTSNLKDIVTTTDIKLWKRNQNKPSRNRTNSTTSLSYDSCIL